MLHQIRLPQNSILLSNGSKNIMCNNIRGTILIAISTCFFGVGCNTTAYYKQEREIRALVQSINESSEDPLHPASTPSVWRLTEIGPPAIPHVLPLLESDDEDTRSRARAVLAEVIIDAFRTSTEDPVQAADDAAHWWRSMGSYNEFRSSPKDRSKFVQNVRKWLRTDEGKDLINRKKN